MNWKKVLGIVRHALTFGGGMLVVGGQASPAEAEAAVAAGEAVVNGVEQLAGLGMTFVGLVASFLAPEKKREQ